ncbi:MAG: MBL fold metallo-hydrolase, partial [Minisyncoccia bacterium]
MNPNTNSKLWAYVGGLLVLGGVLVFVLLLQPVQNKLKVSFLDVGQGDSILIQTPSARTMLIDGGRDNTVLSRLGAELPFFKRSIDVVIATHPDADHVTGLFSVLDKYKVGSVLEPGVTVDTVVYQSLEQKIFDKKIPHIYARAGQKIILDEKNNIYLTILYPDVDVTGWETNDASIVARLDYGNTSFMFTGDSPIGKELYLVQHSQELLPVDVLKL